MKIIVDGDITLEQAGDLRKLLSDYLKTDFQLYISKGKLVFDNI